VDFVSRRFRRHSATSLWAAGSRTPQQAECPLLSVRLESSGGLCLHFKSGAGPAAPSSCPTPGAHQHIVNDHLRRGRWRRLASSSVIGPASVPLDDDVLMALELKVALGQGAASGGDDGSTSSTQPEVFTASVLRDGVTLVVTTRVLARELGDDGCTEGARGGGVRLRLTRGDAMSLGQDLHRR
jgi:hypothetical protein